MYKNWYISSMEKNHAKSNKPRGLKTIMYFNVINRVPVIAISVLTKADQMVKTAIYNAGQPGSLPNKIMSLTLTAAAAYAVGVNPIYIAFTAVYALFFVLTTAPRWVVEASVTANLLAISAFTLPETSVTALEYLILIKILLELWCCAFDKLTQIYARLTKGREHSYYFIWILFTWSVSYLATQSSPYLQGFFEGLIQGLAGN